jgi:DNA-binding NtrC family response regulator
VRVSLALGLARATPPIPGRACALEADNGGRCLTSDAPCGISTGVALALIVEEDPDLCEVIAILFAVVRFECVLASDLDHALAQHEARSFDVVVINIAEPELHGLTTIRELRARSAELKILAMSWRDVPTRVAIEAGASTRIEIPFSVADLIAALRRAGVDVSFDD